MKFLYFILILFFTLITSCSNQKNELLLKISKECKITTNSISILNDNFYGKIEISSPNKDYNNLIISTKNGVLPKIPVDSWFIPEDSTDNLISKMKIYFGKSQLLIKSGDTINCTNFWSNRIPEKELGKKLMMGDFLFVPKDSILKNR